jgi:acetyltransferase
MADISFDELIDYFNADPEVSSILIYMESLNSARKFMSSARAFSKTKPIIVLKAGTQDAGKKAVLSHTGTIAGDDAAFDAAFERAGIIRAGTVSELFNYAKTLANQETPKGKRLAIVTNAGGPAVIATDHLLQNGGEIAQISKETLAFLDKVLAPAWSKNNPIDLLGDARPEHYRDAIAACLGDEAVDAILVILTPQSVTQPKETAEKIASVPGLNKKPVFASFMGSEEVKDGVKILLEAGIPVYRSPEKAIGCFLGLNSWKQNLALIQETPESIPGSFSPDTAAARKIIEQAIASGRFTVTDNEAKNILESYSIPVNKAYLAREAKQLGEILKMTGFPVAMKISAPGILHKTELGGVRLNIFSKKEAEEAFAGIMRDFKRNAPKSPVDGITVEKIVPKKYELIIGSKKDPLFGPVIIFGMGGVAVEIFKDIATGLPPLNMALAKRMIEKTKISRLLKGYRNMEGVNISAIQFVLYKFAYLVMDLPQIKEADINPFGMDKDGGIVLDAKIVLDPEGTRKTFKPYSHLAILPYVKEHEKDITAADGTRVFLRPIMAEDEDRHRKFIEALSEESKRFRFLGTVKDINSEFVRRFTQIDYDRETAIIAEIEEKGKKETIGVARLIENVLDNTAEYAIVIADAWQGKEIGRKMTGHMIDIAKKKKFRKIYSNFLKDDLEAKSLFQEAGFCVEERPDTFYAELDL